MSTQPNIELLPKLQAPLRDSTNTPHWRSATQSLTNFTQRYIPHHREGGKGLYVGGVRIVDGPIDLLGAGYLGTELNLALRQMGIDLSAGISTGSAVFTGYAPVVTLSGSSMLGNTAMAQASYNVRVATATAGENAVTFGAATASADSVGLSWFTAAINAGPASCGKPILVQFITGLSQLLSAGQFSSAELILRSIRVSTTSPEVLLASVRTSFAARHKFLLAWRQLVIRIKKEFEGRGFDAERMTQGLL